MAAILGVKSIVKGIHKDSMQGDIKFIYALERIGCVITDKPEGLEVDGTSAVGYEGIDIDMSEFFRPGAYNGCCGSFWKD